MSIEKTSEVTKEQVKKPASCLSNDIIIVGVVKENTNGLVGKDKDGYNRLEGTSAVFDVPLSSNGGVVAILTKEEQEEIEGILDASKPKGWMGAYVEKGKNVWTGPNRYKVILTDKAIRLNLNNPIDVIKHKILLANDEEVAPSFETRLDKGYKYYCQRLEEVDKNNADNIELEFKAIKLILDMGSDLNKLRNALLVLFKGDTTKVSREITIHTCKTMLKEAATKNTRMFIELMEAEDYKYHVMLYRGLESGALTRKGFEYRLGYADGEMVGFSTTEALQYLTRLEKDPSSQEKYQVYLKRINNGR